MHDLQPHSSDIPHNPQQEPDCSLRGILRAGIKVGRFILKEMEQEAYEQKMAEPRFEHFAFKPVSPAEKQRIILVHQWVETVKDACSGILGVGNRHR